MSGVVLLLAAGVARAWVRLYTAGLRADVRDSRRAEIDSDLWEQQHTVSALGNGAGGLPS